MNRAKLLKYIQSFKKDLEKRKKGGFHSEWIKEALFEVPRHLFIKQYYAPPDKKHIVKVDPNAPTDEHLKVIYSDRGLTLRMPPNHSAATQPLLVLQMLEALQVKPGNKVLEIGTGSGWNAGLLASGVGDDQLVHSIDLQADLVEAARGHLQAAGFNEVNLMAGDGGNGWPEKAPFDRIIVTVGSPDIPPAWCEQLAEEGILLVPFKIGGVCDPLLRLQKRDGHLECEFVGGSSFCTLQGAFWNSAESMQQPLNPSIDKLLSEEPKQISLVAPVTMGFLLFVRYNGERFQTLPDNAVSGKDVLWPVFNPKQRLILAFSLQNRQMMEVYGDQRAAERLVVLQQEWIALGQPEFPDFKVKLVDPDSVGSVDEGWIDERPHATLTISLN